MKAYKHLVKYALAKGHTISVWDGEEWQVGRSVSYKDIVDAIESVEEAELKIRHSSASHTSINDLVTWVRVSAFGLEDDETVVDYYDNKFMHEWSLAYDNL
jgi:hypothetical protein